MFLIQDESRKTDVSKTKLCEYFNKNFIMYIKTFTKLCHYGIFRSEKLCLTNDGHFHEQKFETAF